MRKITAVVSNDDPISEVVPFLRVVQNLIQIPVVTKCIGTDSTTNLKILVSFNECRNCDQLRVAFNTHPDHHQHLGIYA
jgi:hypothetical protein